LQTANLTLYKEYKTTNLDNASCVKFADSDVTVVKKSEVLFEF